MVRRRWSFSRSVLTDLSTDAVRAAAASSWLREGTTALAGTATVDMAADLPCQAFTMLTGPTEDPAIPTGASASVRSWCWTARC